MSRAARRAALASARTRARRVTRSAHIEVHDTRGDAHQPADMPRCRPSTVLLVLLPGGAAAPRASTPADYTYSYEQVPLPPPPQPPPPPLPQPPPPPIHITLCQNNCLKAPKFASDSYCDDGGPDAAFSNCELGTDCADCGPRIREAHIPATAMPPPWPPAVAPPPREQAPVSIEALPNPFRQGDPTTLYVSPPQRLRLVRALSGASDATRRGLLSAWNSPVAFWIDRKTAIGIEDQPSVQVPTTAEGILRDAAAQASKPLVTLVLALLPDRSCHAPSAHSEICCLYRETEHGRTCGRHPADPPGCDDGLSEYKFEVERLAIVLAKYETRVRIALVLEPATLSHLALGRSANPACARKATRRAYFEGLGSAVRTLRAKAPHTALYLAAGDGEQLGWGERANAFAASVSQLGPSALQLRGFATNIGAYQPLGRACARSVEHTRTNLQAFCRTHPHDACCDDPCGLLEQYNSGQSALNYVVLLSHHLQVALPGIRPRFVIDTARNGAAAPKADCSADCNLRGASLGRRPTADTDLDIIDAYWWLSAPGSSDGCGSQAASLGHCSQPTLGCSLEDALGTRVGEALAPEAGVLFASHLQQLAALATEAPPGPEALALAAQEAAQLAQSAGIAVAVEATESAPSLGLPRGRNVQWIALLLLLVLLVVARRRQASAVPSYEVGRTKEDDGAVL